MVNHFLHRAFVGHTSCNAFRHEFLGFGHTALEVAVLGAVLHGLQRPHAAITLELTAIEEDGLAWCFFCASHERANHDAVATGSECLDHIARIAQATVGYEWNVCAFKCLSHIIDRAQLGYAHTGHDTSGADGAGTDAHFHGIGTCFYQSLCCLACGDVAHHNIDIGEGGLGLAHLINHTFGMTMRGVDDDGIHTSLDQCLHAFKRVGCHAHTGCHAQTALGILAGMGLILGFGDVLVGDEANEFVVVIHHGQLLNLVLQQNA